MSDPTSVDELRLLRASVHKAFAELSPISEVRRVMTTTRGWEEPFWARLAGELGLPGVLLPAEHGGSGLGGTELALAMEEAGAALVPAPLLSTAALAVPLLLACGDGAALARYGHRISAGELTATVALTEDDGCWSTAAVRTTARRAGSGWELDGAKNYVVDGATSGLVLVVATTADGPGVFAVDAGAPRMHRNPLATLDLTRKQARLTFTRTPATAVGPADATDALARAGDFARAMLAAEQVGGAQRCLDMTAEYARTRVQFGRPIGGFQAVKQRLAEMLIQVESARSAAAVAAASSHLPEPDGADGDPAHDLAIAARIAGITCTDAYTSVTAAAIQLHGGIGFTWEHDVHLYFKRAQANKHLLGTPSEHVAAIAEHLERARL